MMLAYSRDTGTRLPGVYSALYVRRVSGLSGGFLIELWNGVGVVETIPSSRFPWLLPFLP